MSKTDLPPGAGEIKPMVGHTERDRGSRKSGRKNVGGTLPTDPSPSSEEGEGDADYGGMEGGDYPPGTITFT